MTEITVKRKRKREEIYEESLYVSGESPFTQLLRFLWRLLTAPVSWSWRQFTRLLSATWRWTKAAVRWTLRSSWKATAWTISTAWDATVWTVKLPFRALVWTWQLVFGPPVRFSDPRYAEIHALITRRFRRRGRFITHLFAFMLVNFIFWVDWLYDRQYYYSGDYPVSSGLLWFTVVWGIVLAFHFIRKKHGVEEDRAIEQALEREREWEAMKRREYDDDERYARLADDDESIELHTFQDVVDGKRKNRN